jgi:RNA polymerase sigma-70 factor (ECF subfamily)
MWFVWAVVGQIVGPRGLGDADYRDARAADQASLARVVGGDQVGLAELYDRHAAAIYSLALRILRDRVAAEDTVQEVFTQAWRQARNYDGMRGSVGAWLSTLARSRAIDALRAKRARPDGIADDTSARTLADAAPVPDESAIQSEQSARVRQALNTLPELQRKAIELAYYEGLTHVEIAERLAEPLGTIKTRIRTGLFKLREQLVDFI